LVAILPLAFVGARFLGDGLLTFSLSAVSVIPLITGILYLVSAALGARSASESLRGAGGVLPD
jgi:hypothetical protein